MGTVYLICGKICSGKSWYARQLRKRLNAVIFSTDEATWDLIDNEQGEFYNVFAARVNRYLRKKAAETAAAGADVILDWGFWQKAERAKTAAYFARKAIPTAWHYLDIGQAQWQERIARRNAVPGPSDYYVDEGLLQKCVRLFEAPDAEEARTWHIVR